jgi:threonine dehydrogenase-like Zn-dependent dehydrogenase
MSESRQRTMKAVRWEGKPFSVSVRDVPIPTIRHSQDAIVRLTTSAICGTDLHAYHGRWDLEPETLGHENMGIVVEVGSDVTVIKKGDRVVVNADIEEPFDNGNSEDRGSFGVGTIGMLNQRNGGQAEYMRVPWASNNLIILPPGRKHELDYVLLADIWPTAWWALDRAGQRIGETVVVYGAGSYSLKELFWGKLTVHKDLWACSVLTPHSFVVQLESTLSIASQNAWKRGRASVVFPSISLSAIQ